MEKKNKFKISFVRILAITLFALTLVFALTSCGDTSPDYVANQLDELGVPEFNKSKLKGIEIVYRDYYVDDIPDDTNALATETASLYFEHFHEKIDTADTTAVTDALIHCYVKVIGDTWSVYRSAEEFEDYGTDMSGSFFGIGVVVTYSYIDETMTVTEVYPESGAEEAGIKPGDLITKVEGQLITEIGYQNTINKIRGELGSFVNITVKRGEEEITVSAKRKKVVEQSVSYQLYEDGIGYIKISSFKSNTYQQFKEAVDYMTENGAKGIIYDLRSNPGGYLSAVVDMLSYISKKGTTIVSFTNDYAMPEKDTNNHSVSLPSVVICNEGTASAGELFTAAMRDFNEVYNLFEVTTVGVKTYGKGVMQNSYAFTDGSAITLTVAYYNPPSGVNYNSVGITPDVVIAESDAGDVQLDTARAEILKLIK